MAIIFLNGSEKLYIILGNKESIEILAVTTKKHLWLCVKILNVPRFQLLAQTCKDFDEVLNSDLIEKLLGDRLNIS